MRGKQVSANALIGGVIFSMFLWGLSWPSGKVLTRYCSAINFTAYRYVFVVASMFILLPSLGMSIRVKKGAVPIIVVSGLLLALYSYFFFLGLKAGTAGAGGVLMTTFNPIIAYALGIIINRKLPSRNEKLGLVLGLIAGAILLKVWDRSATIMDSGNIYFVLAAATWSAMSVFTAKAAKYGSSMGFSLWQYVVTLLCLIPLVDMQEVKATIQITDWLFWANLIFSAVIVTAIGTTIYFYSTTRLGAQKASSFIFLVPAGAVISSWLFLDEAIKLNTVAGGILGMIAVYLINKRNKVTPTGANGVRE